MRPTDKATADSRSVQSFAIIKNTGHGNFVIGRFHTRARAFACLVLLFVKIIFKLTIDISMCKIILEVEYFIKSMIY